MIGPAHDLPVARKAKLPDRTCSTVCYQPQPPADADPALMRRADELHLEHPFAGGRVPAWRASSSLAAADAAADALEGAIVRHGAPAIISSDQGSQFGGSAFIDGLRRYDPWTSMDGMGCLCDNVFAERAGKSVKYEHVYLHACATTTGSRTNPRSTSTSATSAGRTPFLAAGSLMTCNPTSRRYARRPNPQGDHPERPKRRSDGFAPPLRSCRLPL